MSGVGHGDTLDPRFYPFRADIAADWLAGRVTAGRFVRGQSHKVTAGCTPLRRAAAADGPRDSELLWGEIFILYERQDEWAWGQNQTDGYVGYVQAADLAALPEILPPSHEVKALRTPLLPAPDLKQPACDYLHVTTRVEVLGAHGAYSQIADGCWVYSPHLVPLTVVEADHITTARRFMETPYLWGGRSSFGIDCSALVQLSLARAGRAVPRDSDIQAQTIGQLVKGGLEAALPGDFLFCTGHVGMLSAPGMFLHANAHHMAVAEEPLTQFVERIAARGLSITAVRRIQ